MNVLTLNLVQSLSKLTPNYIRSYFKEVLKQVQHFVENIGVEPMTSTVQA